MMKLDDLPSSMKSDGLTLLCLELLGSGISRQVYTCALDPTKWVVKVETEISGRFQNVREYAVWDAVRWNKDLAKWFAPIRNISDNGRFMVQDRTKPVELEELRKKLPRIPRFFTDTKVGNWGRLGNRIVCHDYGTALTAEYGLTKALHKADWWE